MQFNAQLPASVVFRLSPIVSYERFAAREVLPNLPRKCLDLSPVPYESILHPAGLVPVFYGLVGRFSASEKSLRLLGFNSLQSLRFSTCGFVDQGRTL